MDGLCTWNWQLATPAQEIADLANLKPALKVLISATQCGTHILPQSHMFASNLSAQGSRTLEFAAVFVGNMQRGISKVKLTDHFTMCISSGSSVWGGQRKLHGATFGAASRQQWSEQHMKHEWWRKPLRLGFVILLCLRTILRKASARTRLAYAKSHGQTLAFASLTGTEFSMMPLDVNIASRSLPCRLV